MSFMRPWSTATSRRQSHHDLARHSGYASVVPYDPAKVTRAPPRYQPAAEASDEEAGPVYDESDPPSWKDFLKAANRARKLLKDLKP